MQDSQPKDGWNLAFITINRQSGINYAVEIVDKERQEGISGYDQNKKPIAIARKWKNISTRELSKKEKT